MDFFLLLLVTTLTLLFVSQVKAFGQQQQQQTPFLKTKHHDGPSTLDQHVGLPPLYIVFGRPGAGKTCVANLAVEQLLAPSSSFDDDDDDDTTVLDCLGLDLDVCVSETMRTNFGKGIYPTLSERLEFASDACEYVVKSICEKWGKNDDNNDKKKKKVQTDDERKGRVCVVSFSFVNTDLRDVFRSNFPGAEWILIDTSEKEATKRINERQGHFYTGEKPQKFVDDNKGTSMSDSEENKDNSDWKFAPVDFPHTILNGHKPANENADEIVKLIVGRMKNKGQVK